VGWAARPAALVVLAAVAAINAFRYKTLTKINMWRLK
jgi:hypothetical protein